MRQQAESLRRQQAELRKLEEEAKREAVEAEALQFQADLSDMLVAAERENEAMSKAVEPILDDAKRRLLADEALVKAFVEDFEPLRSKLTDTLKDINAFMTGKHKAISGLNEECRKTAASLMQRISRLERGLSNAVGRASAHRLAALGRLEAEAKRQATIAEAKRQEDLFKKYDSDDDGLLLEHDIILLCREEYDFELQPARLSAIKKSECYKHKDGVEYEKFAMLRKLIDIAKAEVLARQRQEEMAKRKKNAVAQMAVIDKNFKTASEFLPGIDGEVVKAERRSLPLNMVLTRKIFLANDVEAAISEVDTATEAARDFIAAVQEQMQNLGAEVAKKEPLEAEAQALIARHQKLVGFKLTAWHTRLAKAEGVSKALKGKIELQQRKEALMRQANAL